MKLSYNDFINNHENNNNKQSEALWRALSYSDVKFVRHVAYDLSNNPRCKSIPLKRLRQGHDRVDIAEVPIGGMACMDDHVLEDSGLSAAGMVTMQPQIESLRRLPYSPESAMVICNVANTVSQKPSPLCARSFLQYTLARAAKDYNISLNLGVEIEFQLFGLEGQPVDQCNFAHLQYLDITQKFWNDLYKQLEELEIDIDCYHTESAYGQGELVLSYLSGQAVQMVDNVMIAREVIKNVARNHNFKALFLPKVFAEQAGNGCHLHLSIDPISTTTDKWSTTQEMFLEGILRHLPALLAITMPSTNSFRRMGKGCWTGNQCTWARDDKESPLRVVSTGVEHFEYKLCDHLANMYLAVASIVTAGLSGIDDNVTLRPSMHAPQDLPTTLCECLDLLEKDSVLSEKLPKELLKGYMAIKRAEYAHYKDLTLSDELEEALLCKA